MSLQSGNLNKGIKVYLSTDLTNIKKLPLDSLYWKPYGDGTLYFNYIANNVVVGATDPSDKREVGDRKDPKESLFGKIYSTIPTIYEPNKKYRINALDIEWTIEEPTNESDQLKDFLNNTMYHMVLKKNLRANQQFKLRYGYDLHGQPETDGSCGPRYTKYEKRYVSCYEVYAIDSETKNLALYYALWYDHDSLKYIEDNINDFIVLGDIYLERANN